MTLAEARTPAPVTGADRRPGHTVIRSAVTPEVVDDALRLLHFDLLARGADAQELGQWRWSVCWFPHLNERPEILALAEALPARWRTGQRCDPQILLQFPHDPREPVPEVAFHVDEEPEWAGERRYLRTVGIALSPWRERNGGPVIKDRRSRRGTGHTALDLNPGDAILMHPQLEHASGINRTGSIRYGVYFRWLEPAPSRDTASDAAADRAPG